MNEWSSQKKEMPHRFIDEPSTEEIDTERVALLAERDAILAMPESVEREERVRAHKAKADAFLRRHQPPIMTRELEDIPQLQSQAERKWPTFQEDVQVSEKTAVIPDEEDVDQTEKHERGGLSGFWKRASIIVNRFLSRFSSTQTPGSEAPMERISELDSGPTEETWIGETQGENGGDNNTDGDERAA